MGIVCASLAWYGSAATVLNSTFERQVLPLGVYNKKVSFMVDWFPCARTATELP